MPIRMRTAYREKLKAVARLHGLSPGEQVEVMLDREKLAEPPSDQPQP
jgi:hypothetical protein